MKLAFPSREFDEAVAAVCHGSASDEQMQALNELLRSDAAARDDYILRVELHTRLVSNPDLFVPAEVKTDPMSRGTASQRDILPLPASNDTGGQSWRWALAVAASIALLAAGWWALQGSHSNDRKGTTSKAVAMLSRVADAQWAEGQDIPKLGAPLEPDLLRLKSGLAQIVFYSGARVVIEGPAELQLMSPSEAVCRIGRLVAEVPAAAHGFLVRTPELQVTDLGTEFGLEVGGGKTELHVFQGRVGFQPEAGGVKQQLTENAAAVVEGARPPRAIAANPAAFASLFNLQLKSSAAEVLRHEIWRAASRRLDEDPFLIVHFDFEPSDSSDWLLSNTSKHPDAAPDATIVGCQWVEGRWPGKRALEFRSINDRVRLSVPGEFEAVTIAAWVRVQGLDRQINSLFMSDGFEAGTVHWSIRQDGVLGLTAIGAGPGDYQICPSPPVLTLDQFGLWVHLAIVVDGAAQQVAHYLNGIPVGDETLTIKPPFRIGVAELGNWNARGFPKNDPFMIRNFSGAMDEFCLFGRALAAAEVRALYSAGKPQPEPATALKKK